ncbi:MAG: class I SAM-dependent methyltransferase [Pseudomonadota bacterium]
MSDDSSGALHLEGVPETMLWILWHRAAEQRRRRPLIDDPMAADLVKRIDYDFRGKFGWPNALPVIRARLSDDLIRRYRRETPGAAVVVCLGEGLETQSWRINDQAIRWISVDLPEASAVRERLLPSHPNTTLIAGSALDAHWMDAVPEGASPFISAAGLLMYFREDEVRGLLSMIARRFRNAWLYFDTVPPVLQRLVPDGFYVTPRYKTPPMPWGIARRDTANFLHSIGQLELVQQWHYAEPYPKRTALLYQLAKAPLVSSYFAPGLVLAKSAAA